MKRASWMLLSAAVALSACGGNSQTDPYVEAMPDQDGLALEITGDASEGASALTASDVSEALQDAAPAPASVPEHLQAARDGVKELNDHLKLALQKIVDITKASDGKVVNATTKQWGPFTANAITYRLFVKKLAEAKFGFRLDAKPQAGDDTAYKIIMGGVLTKGALAHRGHGTVGIDLDNLKVVDASFKGQGKLLSAFSNGAEGKTLVYLLKQFTPDASAHEPVTASFVGHKVKATGATAVRLAGFANFVHPEAGSTAADTKEFAVIRARHIPGTGGRGDVLAAGGNIPQGTFYYGASCWDAQLQEGFKVLMRCTAKSLSSCTEVSKTGDRAACAATLRDDSLPSDSGDATLEPGAPNTDLPAVPSSVDDGTNG